MNYRNLIGSSSPIPSDQATPGIGQVIDDARYEYYSVSWRPGSGVGFNPTRLLLPRGTCRVNVNAFQTVPALVGLVGRVGGPPNLDYSGIWGCSSNAWKAASWQRDGQGTIAAMTVADYQVRNSGGHAYLIQQVVIPPLSAAVWLYLLPLVATGAIDRVEIDLEIKKSMWGGWETNAPVATYPVGGKFITNTGGGGKEPIIPPLLPIPLIPPIPDKCKPTVELMENLNLVISECLYKGKTVKGPWTLVYKDSGWKLKD